MEVALTDQEAARVREGSFIELKARSLPRETFRIKVVRMSPLALRATPKDDSPAPGEWDTSSTVIVYGRLDNGEIKLRPGMTGYARVYAGKRPLSAIALDRGLSWVRTEFWW